MSSRHVDAVIAHQLLIVLALAYLRTPPVLREAARIVETETVVIEAEQVLARGF